MSLRTYQTSKRQLFADRFATLLFTVTGIAVIAAVLGMLIFFVATVIPLFVPVKLETLWQKTVNAPLVAFFRDSDSPILGQVFKNENGECVLETSLAPLAADSGPGAIEAVSLERFKVAWPQAESPRLVKMSAAANSLSEAQDGEPFLCFGGSHSELLLVSQRRLAIVQLSADREFLSKEKIAQLSSQSKDELSRKRWLLDQGSLLAQASEVAPPARVFAALKQLLLIEDRAPELFANMSISGADTQFRYWASTENRSLLVVNLRPSSGTLSDSPALAPAAGTSTTTAGQPAQTRRDSAAAPVNLAILAQSKENLMTGVVETTSRWLELPQALLSVNIAGSGATLVAAMQDGTVRFSDWSSAWERGFSEARSMHTTSEQPAIAASVSFGLNTLLLVGEDGKCRAYDIGFYALQGRGDVGVAGQEFMRPRFEKECLWGTQASTLHEARFRPGSVLAVSHPSRRIAFVVTQDLGLTGIDLTTGENIVRVSLPQVAKELQLESAQVDLSQFDVAFEKTGEFVIFTKKLGHDKAQGSSRIAFAEMRLHAQNIEGSLTRMFRKIHYESYGAPSYSWQSASASNDFEAKFSLMPLLWGTLKATFYAMLFAGPLGILAAVYSSEILDRRTRNFVKPAIEMMASLPSVVLGFLAAIVLAPWIESNILGVILCGLVLPFCLYFFGNIVSQYSAKHVSGRGLYASRRLLIAIFFGFLVAFFALLQLGHVVEHFAFAGDIKAFLAGGSGSSGVLYGILILPLVLLGLWSVPWIPAGNATKYWRTAVFVFGPFMSLALGSFLQNHFGETHLSIAGYSQRNALVICVAMGFAIIPIIYSLSEDAFTSVPGALRAGSLACGASVWQTTARVILPTAASGVFSAVMIGFGRAIGETMIVVMATGNSPIMSLNPFDGLRSLSANIAVELPEAPMGGTHYRILFFSGMALFLLTFVMNTAAEIMRTKYRKRNKAL